MGLLPEWLGLDGVASHRSFRTQPQRDAASAYRSLCEASFRAGVHGFHHLLRHYLQEAFVGLAKLPWLRVEDAERTEHMPARSAERGAGIGAEAMLLEGGIAGE